MFAGCGCGYTCTNMDKCSKFMQKEIKIMETEALTINKLQFSLNEHTFPHSLPLYLLLVMQNKYVQILTVK